MYKPTISLRQGQISVLVRESTKGYSIPMERVVRKFSSFKESEQQDIEYYVKLSIDERQAIARELKRRAFGDHTPDIREYHNRKRKKSDS
jgi:hypothetical protein